MKTQLKMIVPVLAATIFAGCTPLSPNLDSQFGSSLNALKVAQTINPNASENTQNPTMDAQAAREATDRYYKSYSVPTPHTNVFNIGVGGTSN